MAEQLSTIVGLDVCANQPNLSAFHQYRDVVHRVKWVNTNLYVILLIRHKLFFDGRRFASLDGLPFPPASFDFVRIANIGLGVPEDEVSTIQLLPFEYSINNTILSGNLCSRSVVRSIDARAYLSMLLHLHQEVARVMKPGAAIEVGAHSTRC